MAERKAMIVYAAAYETVEAALADMNNIESMHEDELVGRYDAAVIDRANYHHKPRIVHRVASSYFRVIPELFGGGALPRKELYEAAEHLKGDQAGLIVVGEPTIERGLDKALTKATKIVKRTVEATTDEITRELQEALQAD